MKKKFRIELFYEVEYPEIEAENEDEAIEQALQWWAECFPNIIVRPAIEEDSKCICKNCPYHYANEDEVFPTCHCEDSPAPCEEDDYETPDIDDDCGFDPYLGCYTEDC